MQNVTFSMIHFLYMADEKKGGDDSAWGMLEIIIAILLIVGLLEHLFGKTPSFKDTPAEQAVKEEPAYEEGSQCGLSLTRPRANEKAGTVITISGTAGNCDWPTTQTVALYALVVDAKGKAVSEYTAIPPRNRYNGDASFDATVVLTAKPAPGTGYVILVPAQQVVGGGKTVSARIPVKF
jgi:hypothetical protein